MSNLNEAGAPIGFLNSIIALNPFGKTRKIVDLMKEANELRVNIAKEKGAYYKKVKEILDKYLVGTKIAKDEQEALKLEYQESLSKSLSVYGKDLQIKDKDIKTLVDEMFKAEQSSDVIPDGKHLEKIPDIDQFKEAFSEKIKAMDAKADALMIQARELALQPGKSKERLQTLYVTLKNWITINAANEALKYAEEKEKDAIKASIKVRQDLSSSLSKLYTTISNDVAKDDKKEETDKKKLDDKKEPRNYITDFDYSTYKSDIGLTGAEKSIIEKGKKEFELSKANDLQEAEDLKEQYQTLVRNVIDGGSRGFIVFGKGGLGKSYTVEKYLEKKQLEAGVDYILIKGASSPVKVFEKMKANSDKLFIFDDADSLWNTQEGKNLLKGALDSKEKGGYISWEKSGTKVDPNSPNSFYFTGKIIFISNMSGEAMKKDVDIAAIFTRIEFLDFSFSNSQTFAMVSDLIKGNKINWKDFGIPKDKVVEADTIYLLDIYQQVYYLNIDRIDTVAPVRAIGVTMQKLKDAQVDIETKEANITPLDLHTSITQSIEGKTKMISKK